MGGMMGGGKGGGGDTGGGVSPEQAALAQYTQGQGELEQMAYFAGGPGGQGGMGPSTNLTQAIGGTRFKQAEDLAKQSDANAKAQAAFNAQQGSALEQIAGQAGQALGAAGGGGGGGGGGGIAS
jgi:hypothetical protein